MSSNVNTKKMLLNTIVIWKKKRVAVRQHYILTPSCGTSKILQTIYNHHLLVFFLFVKIAFVPRC